MSAKGRVLDIAIVVALLVTAVRIWGAVPLAEWLNPRAPLFQPAQELELPGLRTGRGLRTAVMFVDASCASCQQSSAFYRRLADLHQQAQPDFRLVVAAPASRVDATAHWLKTSGVAVDEIVPVDKPWLRGFIVTPTLIVTDQAGVISDVVLGKLDTAQESQFISRVQGLTAVAMNNTPREIPERSCGQLVDKDGSIQIVDIRHRDEFDADADRQGRNIPFEEIDLRALAELDTNRQVMVVNAHSADERATGGVQLRALGFPDVVLCVP